MQPDEDWWPDLLSHIPKEKPWDGEMVLVAEVRSFDDKPHAGRRVLSTALVPIAQLEEVRKNLRALQSEVSTSGPRPSFHKDRPYAPSFWIESHTPKAKFEPIVLSWRRHDKTELLPDPGFLMTYGLSSRNLGGVETHWDDPAKPQRDIVIVHSPSTWNYPLETLAQVTISKAYLQDYLTLRHAALVQVFWEIRWGRTDKASEKFLGDKESVEIKRSDRTFQLNRDHEVRGRIAAQVWGARVIAVSGDLPVTGDSLEKEGLRWPGFKEPVAARTAQRCRVEDVVYVSDRVLEEFEGKPEYSITPANGGVSFGGQWSVGFCDRVGRNLIRCEIKKLYEGVPPHITRHWNAFAVEPPNEASLRELRFEKNIAGRAKEIAYAVVGLGEALAEVAAASGLESAAADDFVHLRRKALDYRGWWQFEDIEVVSRHLPETCNIDVCLDRCLGLHKLVVESLSEGNLRALLVKVGADPKELAGLGTLKLLDTLIRLTQVSAKTGLKISKNGPELLERLKKDGTDPKYPLDALFALHDIRLIQAHRRDQKEAALLVELGRFHVSPGEQVPGYGKITDKIFDRLVDDLTVSANKLRQAL